MSRDAIRARQFTGGSPRLNRELGELARDTSNALAALLAGSIVLFTGIYTEPMFVGFDHEPNMCIAGRVRLDSTPELAIAGLGTSVQFVWEAAQQRLRVTKIQGLAVGTSYRFAFLMVG